MRKAICSYFQLSVFKKNVSPIHILKFIGITLSILFFNYQANSQVLQKNPNVVIGELIRVVPSLKDLKVDTSSVKSEIDRAARSKRLRETKEKISPFDFGTNAAGDPVVQRSLIASKGNTNNPNSPDPPGGGSAMLNFDGSGYAGISPADPSLCAGPNHVIQMTNNSSSSTVRIYNRNGVLLVPAINMSAIAGSIYTGDGDPVPLYDQFSNRFMITEFGEPLGGSSFINTLIVAVSQTPDPTGGWYVYRFVDNTFFVDYPHWGVWPNVLYATSNDFNTSGTAYLGSSVYAFNKVKMLAGDPTAEVQRFRLTNSEGKFVSIAPVSISGPTPPSAGSPGLFVYYNDDNLTAVGTDVDSICILTMQPDFATPANTTLTLSQQILVAPFKSKVCGNSRACIPGGSAYDAISDRIMNRVYFRKFGSSESLVLNHTVDANYPAGPTKAGLRWYEFTRTTGAWSINQQSTFSPDADGRFMGTININSNGQIALAYNHSGTGKFASIYFAGRQASDALGTLTIGDQLIRAGTAYGTFSNRWGDYNDLAADVNNDSLFWTTAMYGNAASAWATRIASFKLLPCVGPQVLTNPLDVTICVGSNTSYSTSATNGTITYKWEISTDGGNTFTPLSDGGVYSNTSTNTLNITGATAGLDANYYRCNISNGCTNTTYSTPGKLNVVSRVIINPAIPAAACPGTIQQLTITFGGNPGPIGGTGIWSPTTDLYTNAAATTPYTGTAVNTVYCKPTANRTYTITSTGACAPTPGTVTVNTLPAPTVAAPTVTQPACPAPATGTIVVNASGSGTLEYNLNGGTWQMSNTFSGLAPGSYSINVRSQSSPVCVATWSGNPVVINAANTTTTTLSYTGPAVAIPDNNATGVNITLPASGFTGNILDLNFRFDPGAGTCDATVGNTEAAVDHTFVGDLTFKLTSPLGTNVTFMARRGGTRENICLTNIDDEGGFPNISTLTSVTGSPVSGNFSPETTGQLSAFDGQNPNGNWVLNVSDNAGTDIGSLRRFSLIITAGSPCPTSNPTVTIDQAIGQTDPTSASPINFTVVFSEAVTGFATGDVTLSGTAGATTATVTGSGTTYNVEVTGMTTSGTVIATIPASVANATVGGLANLASTSTDNTVTYNYPQPSVTINQGGAQPDPTSLSPINFTVVFSETVTGFATGDITLSGTAGATTAIVTGSGTTYNVAVSGMTTSGTVIATVPAGVAVNIGGAGNLASSSTDNIVTYNYPQSSVTINQAAAQADPTSTSPINFTVVFSDPVTGFATGDVTLSGTAGATTGTVTGSGTTYNVAVSGMSVSGTVIATITGGVAVNSGGAGNLPSTSTDNTVTYNISGCTNTSQFPSSAVTAPTPSQTITITTCQFAGEYAQISGVTAATSYTNSSSIPTDYITVHQGTYNGPIIANGVTSLTWTSTVAGDYFIHTNTDALCGTQSTCRTTTMTNNAPICIITCPANITVNNDLNQCGAVVNFPAPTISGTCGTITATPASGTFFPIGITTVNVTTGTGPSCSFTITVVDNQSPSITCPANVTVSCASAVPAVNTASVTATDNCPGVVVTHIGDVISAQTCANRYTLTRTYRATDAVGNIADCAQIITVNDVTPPTLTCPASVTVSCASVVPAANIAAVTGVSDNCGGVVTVTHVGDVISAQTCANRYTITRTYRATDACGNIAECTQVITVNDQTAPTMTCPAPVTVSCASAVPAVNIAAVTGVSDNCGGVVTVTHISDVISAQTCANRYTITRTYRATDVCGNFAECTQTITVNDQTPPTLTCPAPVTVNCASAVPAANIAAVTGVSDNCTGVVTVTHVGDVVSNQTCANRYTITRTYRATDVCGNSATCTQIITVNDVTAPTVTCPTNITTTTPIGSCTAVVNFTPTATDNCTGTVTIASVPASGTAFAIGTTTVNVTATDACGNSSTCSFTVTVIDGQLPVISSHPAIKTVCSGSNASFSVVSTNAVSYQWQAWNGTTWNDIAGATSATLTLNGVTVSMNTNSYRVRVIGLCTTVISNHASLYVNPLPVVTLTTSIPPTLLPGQSLTITAVTNPSGGSYVWYKNGSVISGASSAALTGLTVNDIGTYKVTYTDANGCVRTSADLVVSGQASGNLYVYPNPNTGQFEVRFFNLPNEMATVSVYDSKGARVYRKALTTTITYTSIGIDISSLPGGNYLVEVVNSTGRRIGAKWIVKYHN